MLTKYLVLILFISVSLRSFSQDVSKAKWRTEPVVIDGSLSDWTVPLNFYDDETKLFFALANDSNNIYICFENKDEMSQMKMMRAGMKVSLSTKGKSKTYATITYPIPSQRKEVQEDKSEGDTVYHQSSMNRNSFRENFLKNHTDMNLEGFSYGNGIMPLKNDTALHAAINWDNASDLIYEIAIPKKQFFGNNYNITDAAKEITLSVEIPGLKNSYMGKSGGRSGNWSGGREGRMGEGMNGHGMHEGGGERMNSEGSQSNETGWQTLSEKTSFKQKFVLSANANDNE